MRKWLYLSPRAKIEKSRGSLISQTLKVEENKVQESRHVLGKTKSNFFFLTPLTCNARKTEHVGMEELNEKECYKNIPI